MNNINHLTLDSREVAVMLEKEHNHLLRDISVYAKYLTETKIGLSDFFQESTYKDITGRTLKKYQITKKGCEFLLISKPVAKDRRLPHLISTVFTKWKLS